MTDIPPPPMPVSTEAVRAKAQEVVDAARDAMKRQFAGMAKEVEKRQPELLGDIPLRFDAFNYGLPESMDTMITSVEYATVELNQDNLGMEQVKGAVEEWQGNAADAFFEKFTMPFPQIAANHLNSLIALSTAIRSSQGIIYSARQSVINIGDQTITALNAIKQKKKTSWQEKLLIVAGVVAAVAAAVMPVYGAAALTAAKLAKEAENVHKLAKAALVFSLGSQATTLLRVGTEQPVIEGGSVFKILESMDRAIDKTWDEVSAESTHLENLVKGDMSKLNPEAMLPGCATVLAEAIDADDLEVSFAQPPKDD
ncbi:hypothetical protein [Stackebrandtia nassauensis]|uniref:Uncharacterized protein n=1 Tax=Stackebrandtia nassauensis (strain DSM 44728 / CIP 108903 / NRRL B-16338 / NBRC 102104 / LLR-40K-21) TaxID=446470 RepID=D3PVE2_STANL|nr:hypothetical protein [Stackebrandtia nassauensis]ADD41195.1 hypothetical protein Snas_1491 [Stackebrandtia nassauensis DSM 44728]